MKPCKHVYPYKDKSPQLANNVFIAPTAVVVGDVTLGEDSNIWYNATLRGDVHFIKIGARTNIQDNVVCHVTNNTHPLIIENDVTVGHSAILHGCTIKAFSLIGMGAKVLDGAIVEEKAFVAAGALVPPGKVVTSGYLWAGVPAKPVRPLTEEETHYITEVSTPHYIKTAAAHRASLPAVLFEDQA